VILNKNKNMIKIHQPVLVTEVLRYLDPKSGDSYLDLTAGYGGHAEAVLEKTGSHAQMVLIDRDAKSVEQLRKKFGDQTTIMHTDFAAAAQQLLDQGRRFDCILADIGVSSPHLDNANRGFSLKAEGPLDMRMDQSQSLTADQIVNTYSEEELADLLKRYGDEPKARRIAGQIVANRPVKTTTDLAALVKTVWPGHSRVHPATRTFQALRIAVNDELGQLAQALPLWVELLKPGGRLAVISFHSLEDRIVKQFFADRAGDRYDAELRLLTKSPVTASATEIVLNPRARSAKLRVVAK
jgi:16S rRNA (cytosine1402-N4)-methyltransferase